MLNTNLKKRSKVEAAPPPPPPQFYVPLVEIFTQQCRLSALQFTRTYLTLCWSAQSVHETSERRVSSKHLLTVVRHKLFLWEKEERLFMSEWNIPAGVAHPWRHFTNTLVCLPNNQPRPSGQQTNPRANKVGGAGSLSVSKHGAEPLLTNLCRCSDVQKATWRARNCCTQCHGKYLKPTLFLNHFQTKSSPKMLPENDWKHCSAYARPCVALWV